MNLLAVAPHFPPVRIGGVEAYAKAIVDGLHARGHGVSVAAVEEVAPGDDDTCHASRDDSSGYAVFRLTLGLARHRAFELLCDHAAAENWLVQHVRASAPDVIHLHSGYLLGGATMAAARRCGVPYVVTLHDYWFSCPRITRLDARGQICSGPEGVGKCTWCLLAGRRRIRFPDTLLHHLPAAAVRTAVDRGWPVARATAGAIARRQRALVEGLRHAALILAPTRFVAESVEATGFPSEGVRVWALGLPPLAVEPKTPSRELRVAYIGQVLPQKGVHLLIDAVRSTTDADLRLVIHGPLTSQPAYVAGLRARAGGDERISFAGPYSRAQLPGILARTDLVVVPSVWHEVAGLVIMEAHAAGVPVLAARLGGIPEVVRDGVDGLLFDPFDDGDLRRQLGRLRAEPGLLQRLQAETRPHRTIDDDVDGLIALLRGIVTTS